MLTTMSKETNRDCEIFFSIFSLIRQGAEARLYRGTYLGKDVVVKERFIKKYRHPKLDETLTKERTKAEARALVRCRAAGVRCPAVYLVDFERRLLVMEEVKDAPTGKLYLERLAEDGGEAFGELEEERGRTRVAVAHLAGAIGEAVGRLHAGGVVHGDLTTSNILVPLDQGPQIKGGVVLIDFGLSQASTLAEDRAVDLYVLERALMSTHRGSEWVFEEILEAYRAAVGGPAGTEVARKLDEVRARGRKRTMVG